MNCADSKYFFEISSDPLLDNTLEDRFRCLRDFLKKLLILPLALLCKGCKTLLRGAAVCFGAFLILMTFGSSKTVREFFLTKISRFGSDLADWLLLPFAIISSFFRLILALLIHPSFYFNAIV